MALDSYDNIAENGVIGTILLNPEFILHSENLKPRMFYNQELASIYWAISELYDSGVDEIDDFTVISKLETIPNYNSIMGMDTVGDLKKLLSKLKKIGTSNIQEYLRRCHIVLSHDFKRKAHNVLTTVTKDLEKEGVPDVNKINLEIQDRVMELSENYLVDSSIQLMSEVIDDVWEEIMSRGGDENGIGFPSKFKTHNEYYNYERGELIVIGGRAKSGKSVFFLNEIYHKLKQDVPCAIFDTEMPTRQWVERFVSHFAGITVASVKKGDYGMAELEKMMAAKEFLKNAPFTHIYNPNWTFDSIYSTAKILQRKIGLEFLVFDYIKASSARSLNIQEHNYLGDMTNFLKNNVAGKLNIPVLAGAQMSPKDQRLADSDKINRYASMIAYWMPKTPDEIAADGKDAGNYKFFIDYNRLGSQQTEGEYINMVFNGDYMSIKEAKIQNRLNGIEMPFDV